MRDQILKERWNMLTKRFSEQFADGDEMDLDGVLFLIGVQEVGKGSRKYKKDEKIDLLHVAICKVLEPYGYYKFVGLDEDGWPHYEQKDTLPNLKAGEQTLLMKEAIVAYAIENEWIE